MDNKRNNLPPSKTDKNFKPILNTSAAEEILDTDHGLIPSFRRGKSENIHSYRKTHLRNQSTANFSERLKSSPTKIELIQATKKTQTIAKKTVKPWKKELSLFLDNGITVSIMLLATLIVLFANDIKVAFLPLGADFSINLLYCICIALFSLEIVLLSLTKKDYYLGFFFWMDVIATVSLIFEVDWIFDPLIEWILSFNSESSENANGVEVQNIIKKATNASRVTRVLRVIRLVRLVRVMKLYKSAIQARKNISKLKEKRKNKESTLKRNKSLARTQIQGKEEVPEFKESRISEIISSSIVRKLIGIIMLMSIVFPVVSEELYEPEDALTYNSLAQFICENDKQSGIPVNYFKEEDSTPILNITIGDKTFYSNDTIGELRSEEILYSFSASKNCVVTFSSRQQAFLEGLLGIISTILTCLLLVVSAILFENDAKRLVLAPLEIMIEIVKTVEKDPINAKNTEELKNGVKEMLFKLENNELNKNKKEVLDEKYEVILIKQAIIDISALLAIGFGEAGGQIIKQNMKDDSDLNPMVEGTKVMAIFGFCDIRRFEEIIAKMKEKTIVLVNEVASVVHACVDKFGGNCNRNLGDCFLCVWKLPAQQADTANLSDKIVNRVANQAVFGYLSTIASFLGSPKIKRAARKAMGDTFRFSMGFGLHIGWGIEGAIGSLHKIDASYLSPNVNLSARLEAATKQYGVLILISGQVYDCLSQPLQGKFRLIDIVKVKGSAQPMRLYTSDVNLNYALVSKDKMLSRDKRGAKKTKVSTKFQEMGELAVGYFLVKDEFAELFRTKKTKRFYSQFNEGVTNYIEGSWRKAKTSFELCIKFDDDGPSKTLYNYMESRNFTAPSNWEGCRELMSK